MIQFWFIPLRWLVLYILKRTLIKLRKKAVLGVSLTITECYRTPFLILAYKGLFSYGDRGIWLTEAEKDLAMKFSNKYYDSLIEHDKIWSELLSRTKKQTTARDSGPND